MLVDVLQMMSVFGVHLIQHQKMKEYFRYVEESVGIIYVTGLAVGLLGQPVYKWGTLAC